jgi:hypothetical protein
MTRITVVVLFVMCTFASVAYAQQQILDAAPDLFEDYSEQQLEEWMDELQQLKASNLGWTQSLQVIQQFPWVDMGWVRTRLSRLSEGQAKNFLVQNTQISPTIELLLWLHDINIGKEKTEAGLMSAYKSVSVRMVQAYRMHSAAKYLAHEHRSRLLIQSEWLEMGFNSSQGVHHEFQRWKELQKMSFFMGLRLKTSQLRTQLYFGRLQYQLGSGIIGNQRQRLFLSSQQALFSQRTRLKGSVQRDPDRMLTGGGFSISASKWNWITAIGYKRFRLSSRQDTSSLGSQNTLGDRWTDR